MSKSLHQGRGMKKGRQQKKIRQLKKVADSAPYREVVGKKEVGLVFYPKAVSTLQLDVALAVEEVFGVVNISKTRDYREFSGSKGGWKYIRRSKKELVSAFLSDNKHFNIVLEREQFDALSPRAKSLVMFDGYQYRVAFGKWHRREEWILPRHYWKWAWKKTFANAYVIRGGEAQKAAEKIYYHGLGGKLDRRHRWNERFEPLNQRKSRTEDWWALIDEEELDGTEFPPDDGEYTLAEYERDDVDDYYDYYEEFLGYEVPQEEYLDDVDDYYDHYYPCCYCCYHRL